MLRDDLLFHFPNLKEEQIELLNSLKPLYQSWNDKINLISRKDFESFNERHLLHSLALKYVWSPKVGEKVIDIGTGGGFPGIPLAIAHPDVNFLLVDSIGKKIKVVQEVSKELGLQNVRAIQERAEKIDEDFDTAITRAVARLKVLVNYCRKSKMKVGQLICLKGGDLKSELNEVGNYKKTLTPLSEKFAQEFFETKCIVKIDFD